MSQINIITGGGWLMIPIFACSLIAVSLILERFFSLRRARAYSKDLMDNIREILKHNRVSEAIDLCEETGGPLAFILKAGLLKHGRQRVEIREAVEDAGLLVIPSLERYLSVLGTIANITPLIGLLGTVVGMTEAFMVIQSHGGAVTPGDLAGGIGTALLTTVWGLIVAIPTLVAYNYFVTKVDNMVWEMEILSSELLDILSDKEETYAV
jgi:biopolymer transport protein ExbB